MKIKENDLYKIINIYGKSFEIRYGYYDEKERFSVYNEPVPIFPDFIKNPIFSDEGYPFVTCMQDVCGNFVKKRNSEGCFGCVFFNEGADLIGVCIFRKSKKVDNDS